MGRLVRLMYVITTQFSLRSGTKTRFMIEAKIGYGNTWWEVGKVFPYLVAQSYPVMWSSQGMRQVYSLLR